ncbi:MAG: S8 family peptidase [Prevotellaceae bacterium]|jgi:nuclear transport factor 2 (NTF2) superfamily protein|nr:S8 family peptidase [Prevotellaceae bacterium]
MKKIKYLLATLLLVIVAFIGCHKDKDDIKNNDAADIMQDAFFFDGDVNPVLIDCEEEGLSYQIHAYEGHVIVYFNEGVDLNTAKATIESLHGKIIEQMPAIGYYLVDAGIGNENKFISEIKDRNAEYAVLDLYYEPREVTKVMILDNFENRDSDGTTHGKKVSDVYTSCSRKITYRADEALGGVGIYNNPIVKSSQAINKIGAYNEEYMYNMSFGPALRDNDGKRIKWDDPKATLAIKRAYIKEQKQHIFDVIERLKRVKRLKGNTALSNTIVTIAAGNDGMGDFYEEIIQPMLTTSSSGRPNLFLLDKDAQDILRDNMLIVTAKDTKDETYSNKSSMHNAIAQVDISNLPLSGTSYAAPKALCYITQIMEDNENLTAVQALAEAKKSIAKNNGKLLAPQTEVISLVNTTWKLTYEYESVQSVLTVAFYANNICTRTALNYMGKLVTLSGSWNMSGNNVNFNIKESNNGSWYEENFSGTVNENMMTGKFLMSAGDGEGELVSLEVPATGYKQ